MKENKIHKSHARWRETVCGIRYDNFKSLTDVVRHYLAGHWRRVTCKNCLKNRKRYEKVLREWKKYGL